MFNTFKFNSMSSDDESFAIQKLAKEALQRQEKTHTREEKRVQLIEERLSRVDWGASIFEEYDAEKWSEKVRKDTNIYNVFLENTEQDKTEKIGFLLGELLNSVNAVYEHVNIAPAVYTNKINLEASEVELKLESKNVIEDFLNKKFYSLSNSEKDKLYKEHTLNMSKEIILSEDIEIPQAVEHAQKAILMDKLLEEINFPKTAYYRIKELMESTTYGEVFEQEALLDKWNDFKTKSNVLSRIFASLI